MSSAPYRAHEDSDNTVPSEASFLFPVSFLKGLDGDNFQVATQFFMESPILWDFPLSQFH